MPFRFCSPYYICLLQSSTANITRELRVRVSPTMMATKTLFYSTILLSCLIALGASLALAEEDPETKTCKHQCKQQLQLSDEEKGLCMEQCEQYARMKEEREREIEKEITRKKEGEVEREQEEREEHENPFVFEDEHFVTKLKTEVGRIWATKKFTNRSKLLRGIENFRIAFLEAEPQTFVSPLHLDAEAVLFIVQGEAIIGLVSEDKTTSFKLERGDVIRVPAGTPVYLINTNKNEMLRVAKLLQPVAIPGKYEAFYGPGGEDPESFLSAFSWDVLEAAFQTGRDRLQKLLQQQKRGSAFKIPEEHIKELSKHAQSRSSGVWPFHGESRGPFNLFENGPSQSNKHGRLFEARPEDHWQLKDLNLMLTFANITKGCMTAPHYNTKATKIAWVADGEGEFEMTCPHVSSSKTPEEEGRTEWTERDKSNSRYHKIRAHLRRGVLFVVPAGHPFVAIASRNSNLQIVCFEVYADGNKKLAIAGKRNIVNAMPRQVKELAFSFPARVVDSIFNRDEEFFFPGPNPRQQGPGRANE